jgi:hypothetical protein
LIIGLDIAFSFLLCLETVHRSGSGEINMACLQTDVLLTNFLHLIFNTSN